MQKPVTTPEDITEQAVALAEIILGTWSFGQIEAIKDALVDAERRGEKKGWFEGFEIGRREA
jgi:hypothetical protein